MVIKIQIIVFQVAMPCSDVEGYQCGKPEDGGSEVLQKNGILPCHYMVSKSRRPQSG
jgi:hypothetical protein